MPTEMGMKTERGHEDPHVLEDLSWRGFPLDLQCRHRSLRHGGPAGAVFESQDRN